MKTIAQAERSTTATAKDIFSLWSDVANWTRWDDGIDWAKLDGEFTQGSTYKLKPKGGPTTKATIMVVETDTAFTDVSHLPGAKLQFAHTITAQPDGSLIVNHRVSIGGFMAPVWTKILGKNLQKGLQPAVDKLVALAENSG